MSLLFDDCDPFLFHVLEIINTDTRTCCPVSPLVEVKLMCGRDRHQGKAADKITTDRLFFSLQIGYSHPGS